MERVGQEILRGREVSARLEGGVVLFGFVEFV